MLLVGRWLWQVLDEAFEEFVDEVIEQRQRDIADKAGFEITDHCLYIYGICKTCQ